MAIVWPGPVLLRLPVALPDRADVPVELDEDVALLPLFEGVDEPLPVVAFCVEEPLPEVLPPLFDAALGAFCVPVPPDRADCEVLEAGLLSDVCVWCQTQRMKSTAAAIRMMIASMRVIQRANELPGRCS